MMNYLKLTSRVIATALTLFLLSGCSEDAANDVAETIAEEIVDDVISTAIKTGRFVDSPVSGLRYTTSSGISDTTNSQGEFRYRDNDTVEFFIGDNFSLGSVSASSQLTPFDLVGFRFPPGDLDLEDLLVYRLAAEISGSVTDFEAGVNRLLLLQSLDRNHNPDDGIEIDVAVASFFTLAVTSLLFEQDTDKFIAAFLVFFLQMVSNGVLVRDANDRPVSEEAALIHFLANAL